MRSDVVPTRVGALPCSQRGSKFSSSCVANGSTYPFSRSTSDREQRCKVSKASCLGLKQITRTRTLLVVQNLREYSRHSSTDHIAVVGVHIQSTTGVGLADQTSGECNYLSCSLPHRILKAICGLMACMVAAGGAVAPEIREIPKRLLRCTCPRKPPLYPV